MDSEFIINGIMNGFSIIDGNHSITDIPISETQNHRSATDPNIVHKVERQIFIVRWGLYQNVMVMFA